MSRKNQQKTQSLSGQIAFWSSAAVISLFFAVGAQAAVQKFKLKNGTVKIDVPAQWQDVTNLFGMPLMLLGPMKDGARPVIEVISTPVQGAGFDSAGLNKTMADWKKGRQDWVKGKKGQVVAFNEYSKDKWDGITEAHVFGYKYKLNDVEFNEKSYYVVCKGGLYHLKTLVRTTQESANETSMSGAVKSFTCE